MKAETTISQRLHITNDSTGYDAACKRLLSEKHVVFHALPAVNPLD